MRHEDTSSDEILARALAEEEQARQASDAYQYPGARIRSQHPIPQGRVLNAGDTSYAQQQQQQQQSQPFIFRRQRVPMCYVPCVMGNGICVEMMVDTGAESSVISMSLARELGLANNIDRREQGVAAGVGRAKIVGKIHNAIVTLGQVEFRMEFIVLDISDKLLLLGLDQMRKYKCIVNLEKDCLVFGGNGGVEVQMLPPERQPTMMVPEGCSIS